MRHYSIGRALRTGSVILAISMLAGCDVERVTTVSADDSQLKQVVGMGFSADAIQDKGDYFLVEGDIAIPKSQLTTKRLDRDTTLLPSYQWTANKLVGGGYGSEYINVSLGGLSSAPDWATAVRDAMNQWNGVVGARLRFSDCCQYTTNIRVTTYYDASESGRYTAAYAEYPNGTNPGTYVRINLGFINPLSASAKLLIVAHELGHTVGFRHTNWANNPCINQPYGGSEGTGTQGANQVPGTPPTDDSSVMNGCTAGNLWYGFSYYDRVAARVRYKGFGPKNQVAAVSSGHPQVSWSPALDADHYNVYRSSEYCTWSDADQMFNCTGYSNQLLGSTTTSSFVDNIRTTTGKRPNCWQREGLNEWYVASAVFPASGETMLAEEFFIRSACFY